MLPGVASSGTSGSAGDRVDQVAHGAGVGGAPRRTTSARPSAVAVTVVPGARRAPLHPGLLLELEIAALLDRGLGRGQARHRHAERRAADVVHPDAGGRT